MEDSGSTRGVLVGNVANAAGKTTDRLTMMVIERHGCPLHFWVGGRKDAPCVALLHGALLDHLAFEAQLEPLLEQYRVLLWDCPGHGRSRPLGPVESISELAQDLWAALDEIGVVEVALVGHSAGGFVAQFAQRLKPSRVWAMIMVSTTSVALPYSKGAILGMRLAGTFVRWIPWGVFTRIVARSTALKREVRTYTLGVVRGIGQKGFLEIWAVLRTSLSEGGMPSSPIAPTLLILGEKDKAGTLQSEMPRWAEATAQTQFVTIPEAGHNVMQDNPQRFNTHMMRFLDAQRSAGLRGLAE